MTDSLLRERLKAESFGSCPSGRKGGVKMTYVIICKLDNGNVIPAFANDFKTALATAEMFNGGEYTKDVTIITVETGATTKFIF